MRTFEFCVVALPRRSTSRQVAYWIALTVALLGMALSLAGCGSRQGSELKGSPMYKGPDPIPHGGGVYKVGNPYEIYGRTYHPKVEPDYERTGVASWYGPKFGDRGRVETTQVASVAAHARATVGGRGVQRAGGTRVDAAGTETLRQVLDGGLELAVADGTAKRAGGSADDAGGMDDVGAHFEVARRQLDRHPAE
jgi:hypothetical protein